MKIGESQKPWECDECWQANNMYYVKRYFVQANSLYGSSRIFSWREGGRDMEIEDFFILSLTFRKVSRSQGGRATWT